MNFMNLFCAYKKTLIGVLDFSDQIYNDYKGRDSEAILSVCILRYDCFYANFLTFK